MLNRKYMCGRSDLAIAKESKTFLIIIPFVYNQRALRYQLFTNAYWFRSDGSIYLLCGHSRAKTVTDSMTSSGYGQGVACQTIWPHRSKM